jgi:hypothetical protein
MAKRTNPLQRASTASGLVPYQDVAARVYSAPLLPYERLLIEELGFGEDEYRWYKSEVAKRNLTRPGEYEHIPDIQNIPVAVLVPILVSLAIGVVTTAISYLLQPGTPGAPNSPEQAREKETQSVNDTRRFNQTFGFEGAAELAQYGVPIPIPFGRWTQRDTHTTGGMMAAPALVWSRMFSYGSSQGYKGLYLVGEAELTAPDISGIFMGTMPLSSLLTQQYALYWSSKVGANRIKLADKFAGTQGGPQDGNAEPYDDVYQCPTLSAMVDTGFCSVYTPTGNLEFGAYDPIRNGTPYRYNWQIISAPGGRDEGNRLRATRRKIAGSQSNQLNAGMPGEGAGYTCAMGLISHNGSEKNLPTRVTVSVGDTVVFRIASRDFFNEDFDAANFSEGAGVTASDMRQRTISGRQQADDMLQIGEIFIIARTLWQVSGRSRNSWEVDKGDQDITLKCIELLGGSKDIGIAGLQMSYIQQFGYEGSRYEDWWVGPSYFPLLHVATGTIRNQRVVDATEIGIKSHVWNQASNLCNFPEVPTPSELIRFDNGNISLTTGTQTKYFERTSFFTIMLRPVGLAPDGQPYRWELLGEQFAVTGRAPVDQYNYIRLKSRVPGQFEYRFIPKNGADVRQFSPPDTVIWRLNANGGQLLGDNYQTPYGEFRVTITGDTITPSQVQRNTEFRTRGLPPGTGRFERRPSRLEVVEWLPSDIQGGKFNGWHVNVLTGYAVDYQGQYREAINTFSAGGYNIRVRIRARSIYRPENPFSDWEWENPSEMIILSWDKQPPDGLEFTQYYNVYNDYWTRPQSVGPRVRVVYENIWIPVTAEDNARSFEDASQIADISHYAEVTKSNASNPEHTIVYVNESVTNPETPIYNSCTMFGLALRSSRAVTNLDQMRAWIPNGVPAFRFDSNSTGPANKFSDLVYFLLTDTRMGAGTRIATDLIDTAGFYRAARFLTENRIYFDGVIDERVNLRSYLTTMAPLHLCNFVIANGKFTVEPALPTNANGTLNSDAIPVVALFTSGNIIEDSFSVQYLTSEERQDIRAVMSYREGAKNQLPESRSMLVAWADDTADRAKTESYDLTQFCTYKEQAFLTARYLMSIKRRITHTVSFRTTPEGLYLRPGNYIRVVTKTSPNSSYSNGSISSTGAVTSFGDPLAGTYSIFTYRPGDQDVRDATITITNGQTSDESLFGALFSVKDTQTTCNVYQVDQLTMDADGLAEILASHFPCDSQHRSLIVQDVLNESLFDILE